ncbi:MAG: DUF2950 domain-containing protein [Bryobacter sp.]|nr:DUF2950 domain-containing protein [Bryobacter sp.]
MRSTTSIIRWAKFPLGTLALAALMAGQAPPPKQKGFASPQEAADALVQAAGANDTAALHEMFGPAGKELISSGDPVQDSNNAAAFAAKAKEKKEVVVDPKNASRATLAVGTTGWPMPVPIVKRKGKWYFDVEAGKQEVLRRRIGANELDAIQVCKGFVEAQIEYATLAREVTGVAQYAQRIISTPGKRDGLYWRNADGTAGGPISEEIAKAIEEGYSFSARSAHHGYYFKVLKGQGPAARMGELDYVIRDIMIGGFALIAVPAEYGVSGIKTFIVNHEGIVYEKDLGPQSIELAKKIERFNPDKSWRVTNDEWPAEPSQ